MIRNRSNLTYFNFLLNNLFWQNNFIISYLILNTTSVNVNFFFFLLKRKKLWLKFWLLSFNWKIKNFHNYTTAILLTKNNYYSKLMITFSNVTLLFLSSYNNFFKLLLNSVYFFLLLKKKFNFLLVYIENLVILQIFNFNATSSDASITSFFQNKIFWISFFRKRHLFIHFFLQKLFFIIYFYPNIKFSTFTHSLIHNSYNFKNIMNSETRSVTLSNYYSNRLHLNVYSKILNLFLTSIYIFITLLTLLFI